MKKTEDIIKGLYSLLKEEEEAFGINYEDYERGDDTMEDIYYTHDSGIIQGITYAINHIKSIDKLKEEVL